MPYLKTTASPVFPASKSLARHIVDTAIPLITGFIQRITTASSAEYIRSKYGVNTG
jgi:hypothetical protein